MEIELEHGFGAATFGYVVGMQRLRACTTSGVMSMKE